jgi:hypothetical protein
VSARSWVVLSLACVIGLADIALVAVGMTPVSPRVVLSQYDLIPVASPGSDDGTISPKVHTLLSGTFGIGIPGRIRAQRIAISRVVFYSPDGRRLGSVKVSQLRIDDAEIKSGISMARQSSMALPPMKKTEVSFRVISQESWGITPGDRIYSQVVGRAGTTGFRVHSPMTAASGHTI